MYDRKWVMYIGYNNYAGFHYKNFLLVTSVLKLANPGSPPSLKNSEIALTDTLYIVPGIRSVTTPVVSLGSVVTSCIIISFNMILKI